MFFFFKQKTAYEMRISDWSSDVCSSDLGPRKPAVDGPCFSALGGYRIDVAQKVECNRLTVRTDVETHPCAARRIDRNAARLTQIGRESCRERVCRYV